MTKEPDIKLREVKTSKIKEKAPPKIKREVGTAAEGDTAIYVDTGALEKIKEHASSDTASEVGGVLVGDVFSHERQNYVNVTNVMRAEYAVGGTASITFTEDTWRAVLDEMEKRFPEKRIVGWYHSHPRYGVFLSEKDLFIHKNFFREIYQLAFVIDPVGKDCGFFEWRRRKVVRVGRFFVY